MKIVGGSVLTARGRWWVVLRLIPAHALASALLAGCTADRSDDAESNTSSRGDLRVSVSVEPRVAEVAEPIRLTLSATCSQGQRVRFPELGERLGELFLIDVHDTERIVDGGMLQRTRTWNWEGYAAGTQMIPSFEVVFQDSQREDRSVALRSNPLQMQIRSGAGPIADPSNFRDVTGLVDLPRGWSYWLPRVGGALLLGALLLSLMVVISRRMRGRSTAAERARRDLDRLDQHRLRDGWEAERVIAGAAAVLRDCLQDCYEIGGPDLTTGECLERTEPRLTEAQRAAVDTILRRSDLVKFAHWIPSHEDARSAIAEVRETIALLESNAAHPQRVGEEVLA